MSSRVTARFLAILVDLFPFIEPITRPFISLYLNRQLKRWKDSGQISNYSQNVKRLGKLHYEVSIDLELNQKQVNNILRKTSEKRIRGR